MVLIKEVIKQNYGAVLVLLSSLNVNPHKAHPVVRGGQVASPLDRRIRNHIIHPSLSDKLTPPKYLLSTHRS
jgi:hypothetical protein